jgi:hypothetical protein
MDGAALQCGIVKEAFPAAIFALDLHHLAGGWFHRI